MRLVPYSAEHLEPMAELILDPGVRRFTGFPEPPDAGWLPSHLERYERGREEGTRVAWAIVDDDGAFLGLGLAVDIDAAAREVELGYAVVPAARGRGVAGHEPEPEADRNPHRGGNRQRDRAEDHVLVIDRS